VALSNDGIIRDFFKEAPAGLPTARAAPSLALQRFGLVIGQLQPDGSLGVCRWPQRHNHSNHSNSQASRGDTSNSQELPG
jgi:hypothetical protein